MPQAVPSLVTKGDTIITHRVLFWGMIFGNCYRNFYSIILLGECNVRIGAGLPWKPRRLRLQLQFFSWRCVEMNYCNVTSHFYRSLSFQNITNWNSLLNGSDQNRFIPPICRGHVLGFSGPATGAIWALRAQMAKRVRKSVSAPRAQKVPTGVTNDYFSTIFRLRFGLSLVTKNRFIPPIWRGHAPISQIRQDKRAQSQTFGSRYLPVGWGSSTWRGGAKKFSMSLKTRETKLFWRDIPGFCWDIPAKRLQKFKRKTLSGPLNRLNAILSLLHPLDRYRTSSAIGSAIGRPLSRPISHPNTGGSPQPPRSKPLGGLNRAMVVL